MRRAPRSYDEIVRSTVPDPDSSQRPTARQEQLAREGFRQLDPLEQELCVRIVDALEEALRVSNESWGFDIEIDRETVTLHGVVRDPSTIALIEDTVRQVAGVIDVRNRLVVGSWDEDPERVLALRSFKLDELVRSITKARDRLIDAEDLIEEELDSRIKSSGACASR